MWHWAYQNFVGDVVTKWLLYLTLGIREGPIWGIWTWASVVSWLHPCRLNWPLSYYLDYYALHPGMQQRVCFVFFKHFLLMSITISAKNVRHLEHEYAACQQLKPSCAYSAWSSAQYSPGQSILKCFETLTCEIEGFPPQKIALKTCLTWL